MLPQLQFDKRLSSEDTLDWTAVSNLFDRGFFDRFTVETAAVKLNGVTVGSSRLARKTRGKGIVQGFLTYIVLTM